MSTALLRCQRYVNGKKFGSKAASGFKFGHLMKQGMPLLCIAGVGVGHVDGGSAGFGGRWWKRLGLLFMHCRQGPAAGAQTLHPCMQTLALHHIGVTPKSAHRETEAWRKATQHMLYTRGKAKRVVPWEWASTCRTLACRSSSSAQLRMQVSLKSCRVVPVVLTSGHGLGHCQLS